MEVQTPEQARQKQATHALQTSIRRDGEDVVVKASLIDLKTQAHVSEFSSRFSSAMLGAIPGAITGTVSAGLQLQGGVNTDALSQAATIPYDHGLHILLQDSQHTKEAIELFEEAARLDPRSPLPLAGLVEAEVKGFGDTKDSALLAKAGKDLQAAENLNPDSVSVHLAAGGLSEAKGEYEKAREHYVRVRDLEPRNVDALIRIAGVYDKLDMREKAEETYRSAIEIDPRFYEPYEYLGVFYYFKGEYAKAAEQFKRVTELAPGVYRPYANLANSLEKLGRYGQAEQALLTSLQIQETPAGLNNMGTLLATQKRDADAVLFYERSVALNPKDYVHLLNLADSNRRLGHAKSAHAEYRRGMDLALGELRENPRDGLVRAFVAYFAARLSIRDRAMDEIKQALQLSPGNSRVIARAVLTYDALGLWDQAIATLNGVPPELLSDLNREPDLADFSQDPRFRQLVVETLKGDK
jgi:tetratricopeptide (TPR) repeat protein